MRTTNGLRNPALFQVMVVLTAFLPLRAQNQGSNAAPAQPSVPMAEPAQIIEFLSKSISWYRQTAVEKQIATQPADLAFLDQNHRVSDQVVQLAFDYARGQAQMRAQQRQPQPQAQNAEAQSYQGLTKAAQKAQQQIQDTQTELQDTRDKLAHAPASKKPALQAQTAELESEIGLVQARLDALQGMLDFVATSNAGVTGVGLRSQIEELARSVPAAISHPQGANVHEPETSSAVSPNAIARKPEPGGIWGLLADLLHLSGKIHTLDDEARASSELQRDAVALRKPVFDQMRVLIHQGDLVSAAADTATPAQLQQQRQQLDALTSQFKQVTAAMLPLSKINVLLDTYQRSLKNWREDVKDDMHDDLRELLVRVGILAILVALVFGIGEIWRRTTFRYVHEARRRYQFLLLRRIIMWAAIALIVLVTFASQLGSAITFAGLLTAGVAVALQNVIVSIVAYFFLIGKYGIRVGDRVQIAGVTGEVVELGLVRIHLMELSGPGEAQPTGRVVAFSNSIVFQPGPGVFKQIPGTSFIWHEMKLTLAGDTNYREVRDRITKAVDGALSGYRELLEGQREMMARNLSSVSPGDLRPKVHLHYTAAGIEAKIDFPVEFQKAGEIDDHMMRDVISALEKEPRIKLVGAEMQPAK
jgi:hypothetical protein